MSLNKIKSSKNMLKIKPLITDSNEIRNNKSERKFLKMVLRKVYKSSFNEGFKEGFENEFLGARKYSIFLRARKIRSANFAQPEECAKICKKCSFLSFQGGLVSVCDDASLHMWSIRQNEPAITHSLNFKKER